MTAAVRPDVAELLRAGWTNQRIAVHCHTARRKVAAARTALGIAPARPTLGAGSLETAFRTRVESLFCGHAVWTGPRNENGVPMVSWRNQRVSAYRVAFRSHYGREPQGVVLAVCGVPGCIAGRCLDDKAARDRTRGQLAAVLGLNHTSTHCREGHSYAEHAAYRPDGVRYCGRCDSDSNKTRKRGIAA
ncbi:hypothetical protein ACH4GZ_38735 [Streptomyces hygroscopicus]|uniref:hypothetical protein n=1 Tax=Streptomyces hygroscopicus TaxID=1912 RepID=UPI0037B9C6C8